MNKWIIALCMLASLSACVTTEGMSKDAAIRSVQPLTVNTDEALVNFYHPTTLEDLPVPLSISLIPGAGGLPLFFKANNAYQIWQEDQLAGFLPVANRCLQLRVRPGKHTFLGRFTRSNAGNWTVLQGNLEGGKTYFVKVVQRWNTWKPAVAFEILKPNAPEFGQIGACKTPIAYDRSLNASALFWESHVRAHLEEVRRVLQGLKGGGDNFYLDPDIQAGDGQ